MLIPTSPVTEAARLRGLAEPCVWTTRMLACLSEDGPRGGRWHSLMDKVWATTTLQRAWKRVKANRGAAGVDKVSIRMFARHAEAHLATLQRQLQTGSYRPEAVRRVWIDKPGKKEKRPLGIPAVRDRVVQTALRLVLEPIFEHEFAPCSWGFRPGRGCLGALETVQQHLAEGRLHVVDVDLKGYFDSIDHERLMALVEARIADRRVLALLRMYLEAKVMDGLEEWQPEKGTPQGAVISPLLANLYLNDLDWRLQAAGHAMVRYADDFVILCASGEEAATALRTVQTYCDERGLTVHPEKTRVVDLHEKGGFDFLGYHHERTSRWARRSAVQKLRDKLRPLTMRTNGKSLPAIVGELNPKLRGWWQYFRHGNGYDFPSLDGYIRTRLRAILRKRSKRRGCPSGGDCKRWRNATFHALGLFSLVQAQAEYSQSLREGTPSPGEPDAGDLPVRF